MIIFNKFFKCFICYSYLLSLYNKIITISIFLSTVIIENKLQMIKTIEIEPNKSIEKVQIVGIFF